MSYHGPTPLIQYGCSGSADLIPIFMNRTVWAFVCGPSSSPNLHCALLDLASWSTSKAPKPLRRGSTRQSHLSQAGGRTPVPKRHEDATSRLRCIAAMVQQLPRKPAKKES